METPALAAIVRRYLETAGPLATWTDLTSVTAAEELRIEPVTGGFSGASVYRVRHASGEFALRRWPMSLPHVARIAELHRWLAWMSRHGIPVAVPCQTATGQALVDHAGDLYQLEPWLPGAPQLSTEPTAARLRAVMELLARMHRVSADYRPLPAGRDWFDCRTGPSPTVRRRWQLLRSWTDDRVELTGAAISLAPGSVLRELAREALSLRNRHHAAVAAALAEHVELELPLLPVMRDVWTAHVLFDGDRVSGLIDPAAAQTETIVTDLSRLVSTLPTVDSVEIAAAIAAYEGRRPMQAAEHRLLPVLHDSGLLLSGLTWVERFAAGDVHESSPLVAERLEIIVRRLREGPTHSSWFQI
ncbi:MAG: phosphotransferase [Planctomycetaceae bacterium]